MSIDDNNEIPSNYLDGVPRVSTLVSYKFPFDGEGEQRYISWLNSKNIKPSDYLKEAQDVGTSLHLAMEDYIETGHKTYKGPHKKEAEGGYRVIDGLRLSGREMFTESFIVDERLRYQGTIDLVLVNEKEKKVRLYDWKTWGIAKKRWNLNNDNKKPYDKLKKLSLQLSFYAERYRERGYKVEGLYGIWLHEKATQGFEVPLYTSEDLNNIIASFYMDEVKLPPQFTLLITNDMKIEIQTTIPDLAYSKASVILEDTDLPNISMEKRIEKAIDLQKYLLSKY